MKKRFLLLLCPLVAALGTRAQSVLYPQHFDLQDVTLADGPFKTAMDINIDQLMKYDVDRLLTPYIRQAGLNTGKYAGWQSKHPNFDNWGSGGFRLDGHIGGHYMSALAMAYAACHDEQQRALLKARLDYMVDIMKDCQDAFSTMSTSMQGYIGGQPVNDIWPALYEGNLQPFNDCGGWVTFYCEHKILAGLRDAWVYAGNATARDCYLALCDWAVNVVSNLSDSQMESMLGWEHGGMNEVIADAYVLTGDEKYLDAARRYSHKFMINGMQGSTRAYSRTFLDGRHANTQVPKFVGYERINQLAPDATYKTAAENFWYDVSRYRTVCMGGNSVSEHFLARANSDRYINHMEGPESCNTNNMLKLSELLFDRTHLSQYADFYEAATLNHILSTQDPNTGGYVYFTSLRPQSYRIYSKVNKGMWCCVGTGMENHSKYGHFIYTHEGDSKLYVNLFIPSELNNEHFGLKQQTSFPFEEGTRLTVTKAGTYTMAIRRPSWAGDDFAVTVNGSSVDVPATGYVEINRSWSPGDVVEVSLPMSLRVEECPNLPSYIAIKYGPVLLAARTGTDDLKNEYAGEGRMDHSPAAVGMPKSLSSAPLLMCTRDQVLPSITVKDKSTLTFTMPVKRNSQDQTVELTPFYSIHHARYSCYFWQGTEEDYAASDMGRKDAEAQAILDRTIDYVATGEQQSEAGHEAKYSRSSYGQYRGETYRDTQAGGYIQYELSTGGQSEGIALMCRYITADQGRKCQIFVDGHSIALPEVLSSTEEADDNGFYETEFPIPAELLRGKSAITVRFEANQGTLLPGLYYVRLVNDCAVRLEFAKRTLSMTDRNFDLRKWGNTKGNLDGNVVTIPAAYDQVGWWFDGRLVSRIQYSMLDVADWDRLVVKAKNTGNTFATINIIGRKADGSTQVDGISAKIQPDGTEQTVTINLANYPDLKYIREVYFWCGWNSGQGDGVTLTVDDVYFENIEANGITDAAVDAVPADDIYYDLLGRPVKSPTPGIYIHRGRKVVVRNISDYSR